MLNKNFVIFLLSGVLFLFGMGYLTTVYWTWNYAPSASESSLEVSLPIINWEKYMNLSKHLD